MAKNYSNTSKNSQNGFYSSKEENQSKNRNSTSNSGSNKNKNSTNCNSKNADDCYGGKDDYDESDRY